jgi:hypothetical protein
MIHENKVLTFIHEFKKRHPQEIEDVFYNGYCYYFAIMLKKRFGGNLYFNEKLVHFGIEINNEIYDILGIVADKSEWVSWKDFKEMRPDLIHDIEKTCIRKEKL